jgi:PAS domain S-box-containing protein
MDDFLNGDAAFRHLFFSLRDYAVILLNEEGNVAVWNEGASQLTGYRAEEIVGCHFSMLHTSEDRAIGHPERQLIAASAGRYEEEGWRVRKDGTRFWAHTSSWHFTTTLTGSAGSVRSCRTAPSISRRPSNPPT